MADLAGLDQLGQGADALLDRHVRVDAVQVVEVDVVGAQVAQGAVGRAADVLGGRVVPDEGAVVGELDPGLGGHDGRLAAAGQSLAEELLVAEGAVALGGVEEGDAQLQGAVDGGERFGLVGGAVVGAHPHQAEAFGADLQSLAAQCADLHGVLLTRK